MCKELSGQKICRTNNVLFLGLDQASKNRTGQVYLADIPFIFNEDACMSLLV